MNTIKKRLAKLETQKDRQQFEPFHIIRWGSTKGPEREYYVGEDGFVQVHDEVHQGQEVVNHE
ncbi:hypothetical protein [Desulfosudis oleivorans]|uniref:hypothetical protein n=1 Tax=Desulfosudis oleivorans TaxID=181663 RepID=UPI00059DFE8A|nr:hypothetical protein [Desulfosudis oleivorans]